MSEIEFSQLSQFIFERFYNTPIKVASKESEPGRIHFAGRLAGDPDRRRNSVPRRISRNVKSCGFLGLKALFINSLGQRPRCSDFNKRRLKAFFNQWLVSGKT